MSSGKLTVSVTVKIDDADAERLDRYQRARERETRVPLSRALVLREILRQHLESDEDEEARTVVDLARARA